MGLLKNLFGKNEEPKISYEQFWNWFQANGQALYQTIKRGERLKENFFDVLLPKITEQGDGIHCLTGMKDEYTAELILTADGIVKNITSVEDLVAAAPNIPNWEITALKPALAVERASIDMEGYSFNSDTLSFYPMDHPNYPDEIDIVISHADYNEADQRTITNGVYIFIDNFLGELNSITAIDSLSIISPQQAEKELIPIAKLKDYLLWREKEFVEKYHEVRHNTENDAYSAMEGQLDNGLPLFAIMNTSLLNWDGKASHPWILSVEIEYDGSNNDGLPDEKTYQLLNQFEDAVIAELKDTDGYLNLGRQTADGRRHFFFACREFRKPSRVLRNMTEKYIGQLHVSHDIYKDKYWQSFEQFNPHGE